MIPWLVQRAATTPGRTALAIGGQVISFAALAQSTRRTALRLRAAGLREGDVLATLLWNGRPFIECLHAAALCGATLLPLNARGTPAEIAFALRDASARLLVHGPGDLAQRAREAVSLAGSLALVEAAPGLGASLGEVELAAAAESDLLERTAPESLLAILYTSGTTGRPKGACLPFRSFLWSAAASALHLGASAEDRWLACLPLFHVGGLAILVRSVLAGSAVVVHERFDASAVSAALDEEAITHVSLVPTMLSRLLGVRGERRAPQTLRCVLLGGAPTPEALCLRARSLGYPMAPTYGLTEAASQVATLPPGAALSPRGTAGRPLPGVEIRIEDEVGAPLAPGLAGEICVRGGMLMTGYHGLAAESAHALRGGWFHTGDIGVLGADGELRVLDRRSDLVVSGGENVYPAEVEAVLGAHPDVAEVAVAGEPDPDLGQRVVSAVVLQPGARVDPLALGAYCRERLAGYKVPRRIDFVAELPRTSSGKVLRRALVRPVYAGPDPGKG